MTNATVKPHYEPPKSHEEPKALEIVLTDLTKKQLADLATDLGLKFDPSLRKSDLIKLIEGAGA